MGAMRSNKQRRAWLAAHAERWTGCNQESHVIPFAQRLPKITFLLGHASLSRSWRGGERGGDNQSDDELAPNQAF
jgi:hypothetical protein